MTLFKKIAASILMSLLSTNVLASSGIFTDQLDGQFDASRYLSENAYGFLPVPIIITDPAVEGGLGMMGLFFHESEEEQAARLKTMQDESNDKAAKSLLPPSVSVAFAAYTGNDSYLIGGGHLGFFNQGRIRYMGAGGYGDMNIDFYGFGDIILNKPLEIKTQASVIMQTVKFKLADSNFYLGPTHRYIDAQISPSNINDLVGNFPPEYQEALTNVLTRNITTSGAGFTLEYDSRDNFFSPTDGLKYELNYLWFDKALGSDVDYHLTELTALHYFKLSKQWRTAFRVEANYANSDGFLPPYATPSISMRGIPMARYQGQSVAMSELELIYKINFRWEVNAFAGIGKATNKFSDFSASPSRVSKGAGFRYLVARRYGFNMGIDIAQGPEDTVFYIQAGSAW
ncbi:MULTISPECIES: BamA/TamA family outer membrane protein [Colwellia]|uniref:Glyceraldehyde-3-phosphate dehydrogenase n=1 Tax=Colwellia marinimaniae TaxID=1513592 RepID=A0ABQ0MYW5_9GAMM|nr:MULTISPECIES: BamA/TamA family outer membrane protein [Colwellia]GAW97547.1 glyceraldehyde-3-phosphate dehydrogenase [Colwellia marinimaniae]